MSRRLIKSPFLCGERAFFYGLNVCTGGGCGSFRAAARLAKLWSQANQFGTVNAACTGRWKFAGEKIPLRLANEQRGHYAETKVSQL